MPIKKFTTTSPLTESELLNAKETLKLLNEIIDGINPLFEQIEELQKFKEEATKHMGDTRDICGKLEDKIAGVDFSEDLKILKDLKSNNQ